MKITYIGDFGNITLPDREILRSLKKKAEVKILDVRKLDLKKAIKKVLNCDLVLFHGQMANFNKADYYFVLERLRSLLQGTNAKKALWMLDKVWGQRFDLLLYFLDTVDYVFVSDETWAKRFVSPKIFPLHPAAPEKRIKGKFKKELACDIALFGEIYGDREKELKFLKDKFGGKMKVFNNKFGKDLADLCKSAKVIVVPKTPFDDFFWSDRIYKILSYGGFCLHPRSYGIQLEGFKEGEHYMTYYSEQELFATIMALTDKDVDRARKQIAKNGQEFVLKNHTYDKRLDIILNKIKENETTG